MLENIAKVVKTRDTDKVNKYISQGWTLLFVGQYKDDDLGRADTYYSLGWNIENGDIPGPKEGDADEKGRVFNDGKWVWV